MPSKVITNIFDEMEIDEGQEIVDIWGSKYLPIQWQNLLGQMIFPRYVTRPMWLMVF
jgi:hypothetical protein